MVLATNFQEQNRQCSCERCLMLQGARRIGFREFMAALPLMAEDRGISVEEVRFVLHEPFLLDPKSVTTPLMAEDKGISVEEVQHCSLDPCSKSYTVPLFICIPPSAAARGRGPSTSRKEVCPLPPLHRINAILRCSYGVRATRPDRGAHGIFVLMRCTLSLAGLRRRLRLGPELPKLPGAAAP